MTSHFNDNHSKTSLSLSDTEREFSLTETERERVNFFLLNGYLFSPRAPTEIRRLN